MVFAHFFTSEKLNRHKFVVLGFGLMGLIFMIRPWDVQEGNTVIGIVYMLLAAIFFGAYTIAGKVSAQKLGIMAQTSISFILGSIVLLIMMLIMGKPVIAGVADNLPLVAYISLFVTGLGYFSYFMAIKCSDAATGSLAFFLNRYRAGDGCDPFARDDPMEYIHWHRTDFSRILSEYLVSEA